MNKLKIILLLNVSCELLYISIYCESMWWDISQFAQQKLVLPKYGALMAVDYNSLWQYKDVYEAYKHYFKESYSFQFLDTTIYTFLKYREVQHQAVALRLKAPKVSVHSIQTQLALDTVIVLLKF